MNKAQHIRDLVKSFHETAPPVPPVSSPWWETTKDIGKGIHSGLSGVGQGTVWGLHRADDLLHVIGQGAELYPAVTGAAALGGAYLLRRHYKKKKNTELSY